MPHESPKPSVLGLLVLLTQGPCQSFLTSPLSLIGCPQGRLIPPIDFFFSSLACFDGVLLVAATIMAYSQHKHVQILLGNMVRFGHVVNIIVWFVNRHKQASLQWLSRLNDYVFKEHMFWKVLCFLISIQFPKLLKQCGHYSYTICHHCSIGFAVYSSNCDKISKFKNNAMFFSQEVQLYFSSLIKQ